MNISNTKTKLLAYIAGTVFLLTATSVTATVMVFIDKVDPNPDQFISYSNGQGGNNQSYSFTHSIIADQDGAGGSYWGGIYGYNSLTDIISSTLIELTFKDETNDTALESVQLIFDAQSYGTQTITSGGSTYTATISNGWGALLNDGILNVTLQNADATSGPQDGRSDFIFLDSTLTVDVNRNTQQASAPAQVPEPNTLALISLCLVSLVILSLRKQV